MDLFLYECHENLNHSRTAKWCMYASIATPHTVLREPFRICFAATSCRCLLVVDCISHAHFAHAVDRMTQSSSLIVQLVSH